MSRSSVCTARWTRSPYRRSASRASAWRASPREVCPPRSFVIRQTHRPEADQRLAQTRGDEVRLHLYAILASHDVLLEEHDAVLRIGPGVVCTDPRSLRRPPPLPLRSLRGGFARRRHRASACAVKTHAALVVRNKRVRFWSAPFSSKRQRTVTGVRGRVKTVRNVFTK